MTVIEIARLFRFVRESQDHGNDGPWVEAIQRVTGNRRGDAWCASFVSMCLALAHNGVNPLPMTASCETLHSYARRHGLLVTTPRAGDVFLVLTPEGHAHHTGFVRDERGGTIEGNTNPAGGREGYGVFERTRDWARGSYAFIRLPEG